MMRFRLLSLFGFLLTLIFYTHAQATVIVEVNNPAPPPAPKEVIVIPKGQASCVIVPAGIYNGIYVNSHKICRYKNNASPKSLWIAGHWQCSNYRPLRGLCLSWAWIPSHWSSTTTVIVS